MTSVYRSWSGENELDAFFGALEPKNSVLTMSTLNLQAVELKDGELIIGVSASAPVAGALVGAPNSIRVTSGPGSISLQVDPDLILDTLEVKSETKLTGLVTLPSLTPRSIIGLDSESKVISTVLGQGVVVTDSTDIIKAVELKDGQLLIGVTGSEPIASSILGTNNQVTVTPGPGLITLSLPQDIALTSSPTFAGLDITTDIKVGGLVDGRDLSDDGKVIDTIVAAGVPNLTVGEVNQLLNINSTVIGTTEWTCLGLLNQNVGVYAGPKFLRVFLSDYSGVGQGLQPGKPDDVELLLNSIGDNTQQIQFGRGALGSAGTKWSLSSRNSSADNNFHFYRGPYLGGGSWDLIYSVTRATKQFVFEDLADSSSVSTGAVRIKGGLGVAKNLYAKNIFAESYSATGLSANTLLGTDEKKVVKSFTTSSDNGVTAVVSGTDLKINTSQDLQTTADPHFNNLLLTGELYTMGKVMAAAGVDVGDITPNTIMYANSMGHLSSVAISNSNGTNSNFSTDGTLYFGMTQDLQTTAIPGFAGLDIKGNIAVTGTVDGVDVSTFKSDYDTKIANVVTLDTKQTVTGAKTFNSLLLGADMYAMNKKIFLRISGDANHYIGHNGAVIDGPEISGYNGGRLLTKNGGEVCPFSWTKNGIYLESKGGTASPLNFYSEWSQTTTMISNDGTFSYAPVIIIKAVRIGSMVTVDVRTTGVTVFHVTSGLWPQAVTSVVIPESYRPSYPRAGATTVTNDSVDYCPAMTRVGSDGQVYIYPGPEGYYAGTAPNSNSVTSFTITYNV